jgi:hypothetical protein
MLITTDHHGDAIKHTTNEGKSTVLMKSFFPLPPVNPQTPGPTVYPKPLKALKYFTRAQIQWKIAMLSPYKAPGPDGIPNIVLICCADKLTDHFYYIFKAILELDTYFPPWLQLITVVLKKPGKPDYAAPKAYRPVGLLDTTGKLFSALVADDLSFLSKKFNLLPPSQFGGRRA